MHMRDRTALGRGEAGEVHEAGHVDADEHVGIGIEDIVELEGAHLARDVGESDGEGAAKSAALFLLAERDDFGVFDRGEERADGLAGGGAAAMAGAMEGDTGRFLELAGPGFDAEAVVDEIDDFPCAVGERGDLGIRVFLELEEIPVAVHRGAGAGGNDDGEFAGEDFGSVFRDFAGGTPLAGVEGRLAAAGLVFRENDGNTEVLEHFHGRTGDIVIKGITKAGAHQEHAFAERAGGRIGHGK